MYRNFGKRLFDVALAVLAALVVFPLLCVIAVHIRFTSPGPIFFVQHRLGWRRRIFRAYKFRTMTDRPRVPGHEILPGDLELTRLGACLRRLKLDELPQLFNVLKGDMSIVGPRPGLPDHLSTLDEFGKRRLLVRPGLTGLAQVHGNIYLSWPERWRYDAAYVDRLSFSLDVSIIWRTLLVLLFGERRYLKPLLPEQRKDGVRG